MLRTVKIEQKEYEEIKAIAKNEGRLVQFLISQCVREFLDRRNGDAKKVKKT